MRPVETDDLIIEFEGKTCIHARRCVLGLPGVFQPGAKGGWIQPGDTDTEALVRAIEACPSGALSYTRKASPEAAPPEVNTARLWENGPVELRGDIQMEGREPRQAATLCRCGMSKNKPFCDNSHIDAGFKATSEPDEQEGVELEARDGPLEVTAFDNGPVRVQGNLEIIAGSGRRVATVKSAFFCRCGASQNKPYCDGSHKNIGFTSD